MTTSIITRGTGVSIAGRRSRGLSPAFSRASAAYQSDGRKVGVGVPRFEMVGGRRGVLVEEGTTNLVQNGGAEQGATWWDAYNNGWVIETQITKNGATAFRCNAGSYGGLQTPLVACDPSKPICISFDLYRVADQGWWHALFYDSGGAQVGQIGNKQLPTGPQGVWERQSIMIDSASMPGTTTQMMLRLLRRYTIGDVIYDNIMVEQKPYATSFVDGTRAGEMLTLPVHDALNTEQGTIEILVRAPSTYVARRSILGINSPSPSEDRIIVGYGTTGPGLEFHWRPANKTAYAIRAPLLQPSSEWARIAVRYSWNEGVNGYDLALYYDGVKVAAGLSSTGSMTKLEWLRVGSDNATPNEAWTANMLYSQLRLHRRALTDGEIAAHAAGNIVATDCYHYPFDGDLWPAPGSLGAVVAPSIITRPGKLEVIRR